MAFNILIVDDSSTMRDVVKKTIKMSGFDLGEIFEAGDGKEALAVLKEEWADVILSDVRMPGMDGLAFLKALHEEGMMSTTPVVMVTTEARQDRIDELMNLGAKACIQKPFKPEDIKRILMRVLRVDDPAVEGKGAISGSDF
jgi:two-component system chemotaxis response regulator CheY